MSPLTKVTREQWIASTSGLLDQGRIPADLTLLQLCAHMGVTKGSFYSHFSDLQNLYQEVIGRWLRDNASDSLASSMQAIRDPRDRLRLLRARALETAQRDGAMRRWASRDPVAAAAVTEVDTYVTAHVTSAIGDLGLPGEDAAVLAGVLVHAFAGAYHASPSPPRADPVAFETLLAIVSRAAPAPGWAGRGVAEVDVAAGAAPDEVVLFTLAKDLPPAARRDLRDRAQRFAEQAASGGRRALRSRGPAEAEASRGTSA
jgi:AcrR family transcriptional regulator